MKPLHAKSLCCQRLILRFGYRRRQCSHCKRTWTIRPKKRGRPFVRMSSQLFTQVFLKGCTLQNLAQRRSSLSLPAFRYRFRQALRRWIARPYPHVIPPGPLIVLADAVWFRFKGRYWILYLVALKAQSSKTALFLDPLLLPGWYTSGIIKTKNFIFVLLFVVMDLHSIVVRFNKNRHFLIWSYKSIQFV